VLPETLGITFGPVVYPRSPVTKVPAAVFVYVLARIPKLPEIESAITFVDLTPLMSELAPIVIGDPLTVPIMWLFAPIVVGPDGIQVMSDACAPLASMTLVFAACFSAPLILNVWTPSPERVIGPEPMFAAPLMQYTPGGYTFAGYWTFDPRSIAPFGNVTVHCELPELSPKT
jgi:hypothetical protein